MTEATLVPALACGDDPADVQERASPPALLIVDDDENCCWSMRRSFERRGYTVRVAHSVPAATALVAEFAPQFAVVDLRMPGASGLSLLTALREADPRVRVVMLTGYSSVATAVEAIKLGATDYLIKPATASEIETAFGRADARPRAHEAAPDGDDDHVLSVDRLAWEHIQRTLAQHGGNVSATARALGMHRRTLQRKLNKHPTRR